ncbi:NrfD/PsrC family molybdoenzyme membrane anchor subunit [Edwardsiella piscicida]|uniref:NrfD/PsrC family molybdoenzyme membrane anchor subunit n=1 Tax=Edwardsiella piscicida TaxID=1263550 RepID=UPI00084CD617|nr:NrfD/PsrC family molybdoenzyme membrane anchor subunit [Edwardsiella piscicida]AOP44026.1 polysulfide reductase NrfD [Edwardsiella piscicida]EKS7768141.1 polysulfide reductase NrfD [Edwardsiella piscicida]EKS7812662.1 polysulfide reductase NrfD [Edwardsiella piscicida]UCQ20500.1 polysulfide reductase NrfD [Edwardsiella piscicida]UCQ30642.1 polysulfide reductase NrfD [Edwardsiella piscicida]
MTSPFHFPSLVWDWPIAIDLFLVSVSAGLVALAVMARGWRGARAEASAVMRATLWLAPLTVMLGLLMLALHLTRPWMFWKVSLHYNLSSVLSVRVLLFQLYLPLLLLWLALWFTPALTGLLQRRLPGALRLSALLTRLQGLRRPLSILLLILALLLGIYNGLLLSALKSYPMLNSPLLPALFLCAALSCGVAVALLASLWLHGDDVAQEQACLRRIEAPLGGVLLALLLLFVLGLAQGDAAKQRALATLVDGGFWSWWLWLGVVGIGIILPLMLRLVTRGSLRLRILLGSGITLCGLLLLHLFILYAGQLTVV